MTAASAAAYTRQDTLRGSNGRGRDWWDVLKYDLVVSIDTANKSIQGNCRITYRLNGAPRDSMQIDLQEGMRITDTKGDWRREGKVYWRILPAANYEVGETFSIDIPFEGKPRQAVNPPWDGGFIWTKDSTGKPWISVACQGLGASSWWPCKDYQGDEPDSGVKFKVNRRMFYKGDDVDEWIEPIGRSHPVFDTAFNCVMNGREKATLVIDPITESESKEFESAVRNPINTYSVTFYIGDYAHWHDTLHGEKGVLDLDFYSLKYNEQKARKQWTQAKDMLRCFEYWMGPYPFYEDGYKLVEAPFLGMEHQSAIAYGNGYRNGYRRPDGTMIDRSGTGVGFAFDFIVVHESGHEWFGNNITAQDIADNWLHEGFTTYTETLFAEWIKGKDSAFAYAQGQWKNIRNDRPVVGDYGVNDDGSSDKYDKGAAVVHMIRLMINDDQRFRELLRGLNRDFYHKIVTSRQVEEYISRFVGKDLRPFFDVYLRSTAKPVLEWRLYDGELKLEWKGVPYGFFVPFGINGRNGSLSIINEDPARNGGITIRGDIAKDYELIRPLGWYDVVRK